MHSIIIYITYKGIKYRQHYDIIKTSVYIGVAFSLNFRFKEAYDFSKNIQSCKKTKLTLALFDIHIKLLQGSHRHLPDIRLQQQL